MLSVTFDAGQLSSDGGLVWLARADDRLGVSAAFAAHIRDWRRGPVRHPLALLLRQRLLQIACGYADQDDADTLRRDPLLKLVCGRRPHEPSADLASQPTLSRLENAVDRRACYRLAQALVAIYLHERERVAGGAPARVLLDLDSTDDPAHGEQEGSGYHGYYRQHMYHPLLIFDGDTDQLITAVLRPGTVHASRGVVAVLKRLVAACARAGPMSPSSCAPTAASPSPPSTTYCEREQLVYTIGLCSQRAPAATLAEPLLAAGHSRQHQQTGREGAPGRREALSAESWTHERRVVYKAEVLAKGRNLRFVVTTRTDLRRWRSTTGTSSRRTRALDQGPQGRLLRRPPELPSLLGQPVPPAAACRRLLAARHPAPLLTQAGVARMQLDTLRLRLIKIGGWVREHVREQVFSLSLHLASSHPGEPLWHLLAARFKLHE